MTMPSSGLPDSSVLKHVVDVHCHPTDNAPISQESISALEIAICAMSSRQSDQHLVRELATANPKKVVPCFGYHPWFSHHVSLRQDISKDDHYRSLFLFNQNQFEDSTDKPEVGSDSADTLAIFEKLLPSLPEPTPLDDILLELRNNLEAFPNAMLGEVGLDRGFHVPYDYHATPRQMTPFMVPVEHQIAVLDAQIGLAVELRRNISFHSVKANLATVQLLDRMKERFKGKWDKINLDLHSCGLSVETWKVVQNTHQNVYISFSKAINGRTRKHIRLIWITLPHRILAESDYHTLSMCTPETWAMIETIAQTKNWPIEKQWIEDLPKEKWGVVRRLEKNWMDFSRQARSPSYEVEYEPKQI